MTQEDRYQMFKKFNALKFGTSGIRAFVEDMTDIECYINTRGFIKFLKENREIGNNNKIAVAGDLRESTPKILRSVFKAIEDEECEVIYCGLIPTQTLTYFAWNRNMPAIMVTGSHIPENQNGIKFIKSKEEVLKPDEKSILSFVEKVRNSEYLKKENISLFNEDGSFKDIFHETKQTQQDKATQEFIERYTNVLPETLKNIKIVLYEQSSVGREILKDILEKLGAEVITEGRSQKFIPIDTEKMSEDTLEQLKYLAKKHKPFCVVSMDGDADRPILTDENGEFIQGDLLGLIVSMYLKPEFVAIPVSSNDAAVLELKKNNTEIVLTKIGSPYCIEAMNNKIKEATDIKVVSWERNGGYLLGSNFLINKKVITKLATRDSVLPIILAIIFTKQENKKISELIKEKIPKRFMSSGAIDEKSIGCEKYTVDLGKKIIKNFSLKESDIKEIGFTENNIIINNKMTKNKTIIDEILNIKKNIELQISTLLENQKIKQINYTDGVKIEFELNDIIHLRPSSNAPEFRVYTTSSNQEKSEIILNTCLKNLIPKMIKNLE